MGTWHLGLFLLCFEGSLRALLHPPPKLPPSCCCSDLVLGPSPPTTSDTGASVPMCPNTDVTGRMGHPFLA